MCHKCHRTFASARRLTWSVHETITNDVQKNNELQVIWISLVQWITSFTNLRSRIRYQAGSEKRRKMRDVFSHQHRYSSIFTFKPVINQEGQKFRTTNLLYISLVEKHETSWFLDVWIWNQQNLARKKNIVSSVGAGYETHSPRQIGRLLISHNERKYWISYYVTKY